ncbi:MAG: hypothetical protein SFY81_06120 [Verrucomicrobiota bacterium]|nr:hypothetical protein [Verrucomicrobiota bacterium]
MNKRLALLLSLSAAVISISADTVITEFTDAALRSAVAAGGKITFSGDGTILVTSPIPITTDVEIDASDRNVTIDGQQQFRLFSCLAVLP